MSAAVRMFGLRFGCSACGSEAAKPKPRSRSREAEAAKPNAEEELPGGREVFLDSDDLQDLRLLLNNLTNSAVLILVLSSEVTYQPWCIPELPKKQ